MLPSHREGFPRAAMEAAASGLPVVATDVRGCRQVVDDGVTGTLVPLGSPDALAAAIHALGDDPDRRAPRAPPAPSGPAASSTSDRVVATVLDTYATLAGRKGLAGSLSGSPPRTAAG